MDKIEKLVFLEITNKQLSKFPTNDYHDTFKLLNDVEKKEFSKIANEIHSIWNNLNSNASMNKKYDSFEELISEQTVTPIIVKVMNDYNLDLKTKMSDKTKNAIISIFGLDYYRKQFGEN